MTPEPTPSQLAHRRRQANRRRRLQIVRDCNRAQDIRDKKAADERRAAEAVRA